jgi:hypothetical protein
MVRPSAGQTDDREQLEKLARTAEVREGLREPMFDPKRIKPGDEVTVLMRVLSIDSPQEGPMTGKLRFWMQGLNGEFWLPPERFVSHHPHDVFTKGDEVVAGGRYGTVLQMMEQDTYDRFYWISHPGILKPATYMEAEVRAFNPDTDKALKLRP